MSIGLAHTPIQGQEFFDQRPMGSMRAPFAISSRGPEKKTKNKRGSKATLGILVSENPKKTVDAQMPQVPQLDELHITPPHVPMTATQLAAVMSAPEKPRARRTLVYGHAAPI